ncbi:hypothetical protein C1I95_12450 [Micromonospora craterilacus]|uniref:Uncharacterized protein n=1 Tax=Micromonospora craterilacus TaxID=1655439 RepID=A0A2W2E4P9_9ACTN|nr:hypothetical protein [Micromonospora craterilacus]PZG18982.1 hypothetical protein C1I95_12450 [Micromonospora craterilacus]
MFEFKLTFDERPDDPVTITAGSRDILMWERTTKGASMAQLERDLRITDLYKMAWIAAKRLGHFDGPLANFEAGVELDLLDDKTKDEDEDGDEGGPEDPTRPAR